MEELLCEAVGGNLSGKLPSREGCQMRRWRLWYLSNAANRCAHAYASRQPRLHAAAHQLDWHSTEAALPPDRLLAAAGLSVPRFDLCQVPFRL